MPNKSNIAFCGSNFDIKKDEILLYPEVYNSAKETGSTKIHPCAKRIINVFYQKPHVFSDYLTTPLSIRDKYFALLQDKPCATNLNHKQKENLPVLINSLKDKSGKFNPKNEAFLFSLISNSVPFYIFNSLDPELLAKIVNISKNKKGIVDDKKSAFALDMHRQIVNLDTVYRNLSSYYKIPEEKRDYVYSELSSISRDKKFMAYNFAIFADFSVDENGDFIKDNLDFCMKFKNSKTIQFPTEIFDLASDYPQLRKFIFLFSKYTEFSETSRLKSYIENNIRPSGAMSYLLRKKLLEFTHFAHTSIPFDDFYSKCLDEKGKLNEELFDNAFKIIVSEKNLETNNNIISPEIAVDIVSDKFNPANLDFQTRILYLNSLNSIKRFPDVGPLVQSSVKKLEKSFDDLNVAIPISETDKMQFVEKILAVKTNQLTEFEATLVNSIKLLENMPTGLTLKYPRDKYLADVSFVCKDNKKLSEILSKMNIIPIFDNNGNLNGYNGIINPELLDKTDKTELEIYNLTHKFLFENKVITPDEKLNQNLDVVITALPEFINFIGKKQHATQKYSVDIHTLLVLAYSLENPDYLSKLNSQDKAMLKLLCLFHDLGKKEGVVDHGHQHLSALYSSDISKKIFKSQKQIDRLYNLIDSHHWLAQYNTSQNKDLTSQELAFKFRLNNDFEISKIVAKSDLKGVSHKFYSNLAYCFNDKFLQPIQDNLDFLYGTGNALFPNRIVNKAKAMQHTVSYKGQEYSVINLRKIPDEANMGDYGFEYGTKKKDLMLLVHMIGNHNRHADLVSLKLLGQNSSSGAVSESLITPQNTNTYQNRRFGVLLAQDNMNISAINSQNQGSGYKKNLQSFVHEIFHPQAWENRQKFKNNLLKSLNISSSAVTFKEFAEFYKDTLSSKTSLSQIDPIKTYKLGKYDISGSDLINALDKYQKSLVDVNNETHNEIIAFAPRMQAIIAKAEGLYDVPKEVLDFSLENNLPIILI